MVKKYGATIEKMINRIITAAKVKSLSRASADRFDVFMFQKVLLFYFVQLLSRSWLLSRLG